MKNHLVLRRRQSPADPAIGGELGKDGFPDSVHYVGSCPGQTRLSLQSRHQPAVRWRVHDELSIRARGRKGRAQVLVAFRLAAFFFRLLGTLGVNECVPGALSLRPWGVGRVSKEAIDCESLENKLFIFGILIVSWQK